MILSQIPPYAKMATGGIFTWPLMGLVPFGIDSIFPGGNAGVLSQLIGAPIFFGGIALFFIGLVQNHKMHTNAYLLEELKRKDKEF